ncbi:MAG TPA: PAS domain S-box protein, partial [Actinomycetota bacterium]|nr:PAS domain S-box protein [Actinomycetota bacterium]
QAHLTPGEDFVGFLYPAMDLALASVSLILLHGSGARSASNRLISVAIALTVATDLVYAGAVADGTYRSGIWYDAGWLLSYALWGVAALHHSAAAAPVPASERRLAMRPSRLLLPSAVVLLAVLFVRELTGRPISVAVALGAGGLVFVLSLVRIRGLLQELHEHLDEVEDQRRAYRTLMDHASDAIFISRDGRYVDVNDSACALTGYTRAELLELPFGTLSRAAPRTRIDDLLARLERGESIREEMVLTRKDGSTVPIESSARKLPDGRFQSIVRDISERLESAEALRSSEERFRSAFESPAAGMALVAADGTILQINSTLGQMLGVAPRELEGTPFVALAGDEHRDALQDAFERLAREREGREQLEVELNASSGATTCAEVSLASSDSPSGRTVVAHVVDQTVSRELEDRLRQSQKMEAVGQLAGGVAHDFNNLLSVIVNYTRFAQDAAGPDEGVRQDLEEVLQAATRGERLVRQLLAFSRRERLQPEVVALDDVVSEVADLLRRMLRESISLELDLAAPGVHVELDRVQLEHVLLNLAVNARDAMPSGGSLRIATAAGGGGLSAHLIVTDTGCGMTPEVRERAFEPFFTTKERGSGTGLGLATVYGAVSGWGGTIDVVSAPGRGTRFDIRMPAAEAAPGPSSPDEGAGPDGRCATVLVAEDEPSLRSIVRRILERHGYRVLMAESSREALEMIEAGVASLDLLLTDVVMPEVSGKDLAERVRSEVPDVAVLYMSGYTDQIVAQHGLSPNGDSFLQKPFTADDLAGAVSRALARGRRRPQHAATT